MAPRLKNNVCVLGGGLWGVVLTQHLAQRGVGRLRLWEFLAPLAESLQRTRRHAQIPGFRLDDVAEVSADLAHSVADADLIVVALPSVAVAATVAGLRKLGTLASGVRVVNVSKGLEHSTLTTLGTVIERELPAARGRVWTLSGPSFAREVARGVPTRLVLGGPAGARAKELAALFHGGALSVETCADRIGVELGGSLKNAVAVGAGILDGLGAGANTKAALLAVGLAEMSRLIRACGGRAETIYGVAGLGDLIATGTSPESRNRAFGEKVGRGVPPAQALKEIPTVVEGIEAASSATRLCRRRRLPAPLIGAIDAACRGKGAKGVLKALGF